MSECNSIENTDLTYQKNKDMVLNEAKNYYKNDKDRLREQEINTETCLKKKIKNENKQEINIKTYLKNKKIRKENMEKIDITRCLKKKNKTKRISKKLLSNEVKSKSSLIRFSNFLFLTSCLHSSKSI